MQMYLNPDHDFENDGADKFDFQRLRQMNRSSLIGDAEACTWKSLVQDLSRIFAELKPTIVVMPHPGLDPNPDHLFATVALLEALQSICSRTGRMFLLLGA